MELMSPPISALATNLVPAFASAAHCLAQSNPERTEFVQSARSSREHFMSTGLHITLDEFSTWADAIQTNPEAQMPQCHV